MGTPGWTTTVEDSVNRAYGKRKSTRVSLPLYSRVTTVDANVSLGYDEDFTGVPVVAPLTDRDTLDSKIQTTTEQSIKGGAT